MRKDSCLTEGTSCAGCQHKAARHVPSLTSEVQRSYIITTVQLNSIKFSLEERRRHAFKTRYVSLECFPHPNCWSPEHTGRLQCPGHPHPGLLLAAQGLQLLVTSTPLMTTGSSAGPVAALALFRCGGRHSAQKGIHVPGWGLLHSWLPPGAALLFLLPGTNVQHSGKHYCLGAQAVKITQHTQRLHRVKSASCGFKL